MNLSDLRKHALHAEVLTLTSGTIQAKTGTYTQRNKKSNDEGQMECVINAFYFEHPIQGGILIDAGFSSEFYTRPPYGNLNLILKIFQKINEVSYKQEKGMDIKTQVDKHKLKPLHVFLTHRHPDHTSGITELGDRLTVHYGKKEDSFFYSLLTRKHLRGKTKTIIDFEKSIRFESFERAVDIFGDQSLLALSTKGHTKDHIAYLVNGKKAYLIVGDAELTIDAVQKGLYVNSDYGKTGEKDARESAECIRNFSRLYPEIEICYSHDMNKTAKDCCQSIALTAVL